MTSKAIISSDDIVSFNCPTCHRHTKVPLTVIGKKHRAKIKCVCNTIFTVEIEFRTKYRKQVDLPGFYEISQQKKADILAGADVRWESVMIDRKVPSCRIIDISRSGIGFLITDQRKLYPDDIIRLIFKLDNTAETEIVQECEVRHVKENFVGCRMLTENVSLGFYLLN